MPPALCGTMVTGSFTTASCVLASGTATDTDGSPVNVRIFEGAGQIAFGPAATAFAIPLSFAPIVDGLPKSHTLRAYAVDIPTGTNVQLGIDNTIICNPPPPTVTITAIPANLPFFFGTSNITWSSTQAVSCTGSAGSGAWSGPRATGGVFSTGALMGSTTYTMTCVNAGGSDMKSATVSVGAPPPPVISGVSQPSYCTSGPSATVSWNSVVQPQMAYQLQISTDATFTIPSAIKYDSLKQNQFVAQAKRSWYTHILQRVISLFVANASTSSSATVPLGILQFGTTYYARVQVWGSGSVPTGYSAASAPIILPVSAYPSFTFSVKPAKPLVKDEAMFSDDTGYSGDAILQRTWDFGDATIVNEMNPVTNTIPHTYADAASGLTAKMTVTTASMKPGDSCSVTLPINVSKPIPIFKEVRPQ